MSAATIPAFEPTPNSVDGMRAVGVSWPLFERMARRIASRITTDADDADDLVASAMGELWEIDPSRYRFQDRMDVGYVRTILVNHMWRVWGSEQNGEEILAANMEVPLPEWVPRDRS